MKIQGVIKTYRGWGDSLRAGAGGISGTVQMGYILTDRIIKNFGIGGQTSTQIAGRCGGDPIYVTLTGNAFSGTSTITITAINITFLSTPADTADRVASGWINGVRCLIKCNGTTDVYTVTPLYSNSDSIPSGSQFIPDEIVNSRGEINTFWLGRNDAFPRTDLPARVQRCVDITKDASNRYLVIGVLPSLTEITGTAGNNDIVAVNAILKATHKERYIESLPPTTEEMAYIGYTPDAQDLIDIGNGVFPTGMHYNPGPVDPVHLNTFGYQIIMLRELRRLASFGW